MPLLIAFHALAAVFWVGGMFFAYAILRPSLGGLETAARQALWRAVLKRFFPWVFACVVVLLISGYMMLFGYLGGFAGAGMAVQIMHLLGWVMFLLFFHLYFSPWRRYRRARDAADGEAASAALEQIRYLVAINLALGIVTAAIGASGRYWS
jgi:uncharacterized membrane protein